MNKCTICGVITNHATDEDLGLAKCGRWYCETCYQNTLNKRKINIKIEKEVEVRYCNAYCDNCSKETQHKSNKYHTQWICMECDEVNK